MTFNSSDPSRQALHAPSSQPPCCSSLQVSVVMHVTHPRRQGQNGGASLKALISARPQSFSPTDAISTLRGRWGIIQRQLQDTALSEDGEPRLLGGGGCGLHFPTCFCRPGPAAWQWFPPARRRRTQGRMASALCFSGPALCLPSPPAARPQTHKTPSNGWGKDKAKLALVGWDSFITGLYNSEKPRKSSSAGAALQGRRWSGCCLRYTSGSYPLGAARGLLRRLAGALPCPEVCHHAPPLATRLFRLCWPTPALYGLPSGTQEPATDFGAALRTALAASASATAAPAAPPSESS